MRVSYLCAAICVMAAATPALSQPVSRAAEVKGFYATLGVGASWPQNVSVDDRAVDNLLGANVDGTFNTGGGFAGDVGVGYDFGDIRAELTYAYSRATINSLGWDALGQSGTIDASAGVNRNSVFASAYYDVPTKSRWTPYLGGGIGYSNVSVGTASVDVLGTRYSASGGSKGLFGYQAKVGVSYMANPKTDVYVEGVYQGAPGFSIDTTDYGSLNSWGAKVGFRYRFGHEEVAPVAEVPAPVQVPQQEPAPVVTPEPAPQQPIRGLW